MKKRSELKRVQLSKNLWLHEYIDEATYRDYEARNKLHYLVWKLDARMIDLDQFLRDKFGAVTINNWMGGGKRNWSGLRVAGSPYFSKDSQHAYGRASDKLFSNVKAVIKDIQDNYETVYKELGLRGLELRATWCHTDFRLSKELITFTP